MTSWKFGLSGSDKDHQKWNLLMLSLCTHLWTDMGAQAMSYTCNFPRRIALEKLKLSYPEVPGNYAAFTTLETCSQWLTKIGLQKPFFLAQGGKILLQFTFRSFPLGQDKARFHLKPHSCIAPFPSLFCFSHSLIRFSKESSKNKSYIYEPLSQALILGNLT